MGCAFYSEAQIWPWVRDPEFVMFAVNWTDKEDLVCHKAHKECPREDPHLFSECKRFVDEPHIEGGGQLEPPREPLPGGAPRPPV